MMSSYANEIILSTTIFIFIKLVSFGLIEKLKADDFTSGLFRFTRPGGAGACSNGFVTVRIIKNVTKYFF